MTVVNITVDMICTLNNKQFQMVGQVESVLKEVYEKGEQTAEQAQELYETFFGSFVSLANQGNNKPWYTYVSTNNVKCINISFN